MFVFVIPFATYEPGEEHRKGSRPDVRPLKNLPDEVSKLWSERSTRFSEKCSYPSKFVRRFLKLCGSWFGVGTVRLQFQGKSYVLPFPVVAGVGGTYATALCMCLIFHVAPTI